jgi:hypothetical protein
MSVILENKPVNAARQIFQEPSFVPETLRELDVGG